MSDNPLIGNNGINGPNFQIDPSLIAPPASSQNTLIYDVLSPSDQEVANKSASSSSPLLGTPTIDSTSAYYALSAKMNAITEAVLAGWAKSIQEQKEEVEAYLKSPAYLTLLQIHSAITMLRNDSEKAVSTDIAIKGLTNVQAPISGDPLEVGYNLNAVNYAASPIVLALISDAAKTKPAVSVAAMTSVTATSSTDADLIRAKNSSKDFEIGPEHFIAASLILAAGIAPISQTSAVNPTSSDFQIQPNVIKDAFTSIVPIQDQSAAAVLAAGWFSAMWGTAMLYQTSAENLGKYKGTESDASKQDLNFAKTYAETLAGSLNTPQFNQSMALAIYKSQENVPTDQRQDPTKLISQGKIVLLSVALALIAKLDVAGSKSEGWVNELELEGLIKGTADLTRNDINGTASIKRLLADQINIELSKLSGSESSEILASIKAYIASNPSTEEMLDQQKVFNRVLPSVLNPKDYDTGLLSQKSV